MSLKDKIKTLPLNLKKVHIKEWDEDIYIRRLTLNDVALWDESRMGIKDDNDPRWIKSRAVYLSLCLCNADGKREFAQASELGEIDNSIITVLAEAALDHNGLTKKSQEEIEKKV